MSENVEYAVSFAARKKESDEDFVHAFAVFYHGDPSGNRTVRRAAGFYPNPGTKVYKAMFGAEGKIYDDSRDKIDDQIVFLVNKETFDRVVAVRTTYENGKSYVLGWQDCVGFIADSAAQIGGANVPARITNLTPSAFIRAMMAKN